MDGDGGGYLGEFEQMVLLAILQLEDDGAFAIRIAEELERRAGRRVSRGSLYSSLDRLERKGFLRWEVSPATEERGGQPRRRFEVTAEGREAISRVHEAWLNLTHGLEDVLGG